eukprot:sb/3468158/
MVAMATKSVTVVTELLDCFLKQSITVSRVKTAAPKKRAGLFNVFHCPLLSFPSFGTPIIMGVTKTCDAVCRADTLTYVTLTGVLLTGVLMRLTNYVKCDQIAGDLRELMVWYHVPTAGCATQFVVCARFCVSSPTVLGNRPLGFLMKEQSNERLPLRRRSSSTYNRDINSASLTECQVDILHSTALLPVPHPLQAVPLGAEGGMMAFPSPANWLSPRTSRAPCSRKEEKSREKTEGTKVISVLTLVGVGAKIKCTNNRFWPYGYSHFGMV